MEDKVVRRAVLAFLRAFSNAHGFIRYTPTILLKERENVLRVIGITFRGAGIFHCDVAVMPLYVPTAIVNGNLGSRLERFCLSHVSYGNGGDVDRDLDTVEHLLVSAAFPWLEEMGTPKGIIRLLTESPAYNLVPIWDGRDKYLGYTYAYLGLYEDALFHLTKAIDKSTSDDRDWAIRKRQDMLDLRFLIENAPDQVYTKIQGNIESIRTELRLPSLT